LVANLLVDRLDLCHFSPSRWIPDESPNISRCVPPLRASSTTGTQLQSRRKAGPLPALHVASSCRV